MLKVLIADDHAIVRRGLKEILQDAFETDLVVGEARDGREALALARSESWDVMVLDITMPHRNGVEVLEELRVDLPSMPIVMLSMHSGLPYVLKSLKAGAAGYLNKETAPEELVLAIQTVLAGGRYISRDLGRNLGLEG